MVPNLVKLLMYLFLIIESYNFSSTRIYCSHVFVENSGTEGDDHQSAKWKDHWRQQSKWILNDKTHKSLPYTNIVSGRSKEWSNFRHASPLKRSNSQLLGLEPNPSLANSLEDLNISNPISKYHCPINLLYGNNLTVKNYFLMLPANNGSCGNETLAQIGSSFVEGELEAKAATLTAGHQAPANDLALPDSTGSPETTTVKEVVQTFIPTDVLTIFSPTDVTISIPTEVVTILNPTDVNITIPTEVITMDTSTDNLTTSVPTDYITTSLFSESLTTNSVQMPETTLEPTELTVAPSGESTSTLRVLSTQNLTKIEDVFVMNLERSTASDISSDLTTNSTWASDFTLTSKENTICENTISPTGIEEGLLNCINETTSSIPATGTPENIISSSPSVSGDTLSVTVFQVTPNEVLLTLDKYCETFSVNDTGSYTIIPINIDQQAHLRDDKSKMGQIMPGAKKAKRTLFNKKARTKFTKTKVNRSYLKRPLLTYNL